MGGGTMIRRLHIESRDLTLFMEADPTLSGLTVLETLRKTDSRFKRKRIKDVLQVHPDLVPVNKLMERK
jgi:hypothetical protein